MRRKLVSANWKMNGSRAANAAWLAEFDGRDLACDVVVCAPYVYLPQVIEGLRGGETGAQNLSAEAPGAFTGEIAGEMLLDLGCRWAIVGHSERRAFYGESNDVIAAKAARAIGLGLRPIVCVGETLAEREAGRTQAVIDAQLDAVLARCTPTQLLAGAVAYEPVWAIGTGKTASPARVQEVHAAIRARLARVNGAAAAQLRLLYGGSVKPANAFELFTQPDVDGGLIGGASLQARDFRAICETACEAAR